MKTLPKVLTGMLLISSTYLQAQTADEVVNKHIDAIGGSSVIGSIKSMVMDGELIAPGATLNSKIYLVNGKAFKSEITMPEQQFAIYECITNEGGWTLNPLAGQTEPQPMPEERVKSSQGDLDVGGKLFRYKEKGSTVELAGNETINGVNAIKLRLKDKNGKETVYYFDPNTYYILRSESSTTLPDGQELAITTNYSNYKKTDIGYVIAFTRVRNAGQEITNNVTKVEFNKDIDPKVFEMPK